MTAKGAELIADTAGADVYQIHPEVTDQRRIISSFDCGSRMEDAEFHFALKGYAGNTVRIFQCFSELDYMKGGITLARNSLNGSRSRMVLFVMLKWYLDISIMHLGIDK